MPNTKINNYPYPYCRQLTKDLNKDDLFELESRGPVFMKGKPEPMNCWFLNRSKSEPPQTTAADEITDSS